MKNWRFSFALLSFLRNFGFAELTMHSAMQNEKLAFFFCIALVFA